MKKLITFHYAINRQQYCQNDDSKSEMLTSGLFFILYVCAPCYVSSFQKDMKCGREYTRRQQMTN